ncbi:3-deoxy-D-manno-octulosonic acid transferase [Kaistella antarctica]|uniref:3-deoxy-D-manno-octulosonic acid transferase n=1 Tax=Kaistella antarctica TaxID=266748 RepID=A0A448NS50_9FLAO|nr:glycosyltransferase N-terminal domain-containing protein [Kaistella antarctica]KEY17740.1 3-deoxy-D-manno-octulosonic acid transferase [Kaistella antarctica]SEV79566.1 3-deoxy-D-manno-octulosonic-acid transferase [Kaistella antarctica]VEH99858.1 3-deoxy-D-manno-octulosonic-acid transferase [Kaistella antarctica]
MFFYNNFIRLLISSMRIGAVFNYKLKKGLAGRRQSCDIVKSKLSLEDKVIWMHAASLGEYEQGLPVLEKLKDQYPTHKILVTFFSPSGYDNVIKKDTIADVVCYLPFDTEKWMQEFTSNFKTDIFFTVKYDYWYHLLEELKNQEAKIYVVSALFYETQVFFKAYGSWFVKQLKKNVDFFFHQTKHSTALAKGIGLKNSITTGDTRYDRVRKLRTRDNSVDFIEEFKLDHKTIIFGSSWEAEERLAEIVAANNKDVKLIIAPHDLKRVAAIQTIFPAAVLYSQITDKSSVRYSNVKVLIIDCIGLLSKLYSYGDIAVVGGGFHSKGLHNILEAATFGMPVFFGDQYTKNPEADELIAKNGGKSFEDEFFAAPYILALLKDAASLEKMGNNARAFIEEQPIASNIIVEHLIKNSNS